MAITIEEMAAFCKRKGFVFPSSELYGGLAGFFDYGPFGVELKKNIVREWWRFMVLKRENIVGMDGAIISPEAVWKASGHLSSGFADVLLSCSKCKTVVRADVFIQEATGKDVAGASPEEIDRIVREENLACPACNSAFKKASLLNLMFPVTIGVSDDSGVRAYLRGETTQMIYLDFKLVAHAARLKLPCGIAQVGKAFRNEISPRNFLFRCREFEQMEMQFFIRGAEEAQWFSFWKKERLSWWSSLGVKKERLRFHPHKKEELAHYAKAAEDIEYAFPFGWKEIEGVHNRGDWDLSNHAKQSKKSLAVFDEEAKQNVTPHVIETSAGLDRAFLAFLFEAFDNDQERGNIVLHLHPRLAPVKFAVFPLVKKGGLREKAREVFSLLQGAFDDAPVVFDDGGSIGRRYARQDEIGTPFCITVDFDSLEKNDVTVRDRDSTRQVRVPLAELEGLARRLVRGDVVFSSLIGQFEECEVKSK